MFRLRDVQAFKRPSERNQGSLYQAVKTNIVDAENGWILRSNDLAALAHDAEHGWVNVWLENTLDRVSRNTLLVSKATAHFYCYFIRKDPCSRLLSITPNTSGRLFHWQSCSNCVHQIRLSEIQD